MNIEITEKDLQYIVSGLSLLKTDLIHRRKKFYSNKNACQIFIDAMNEAQLLTDKLLKFVKVKALD